MSGSRSFQIPGPMRETPELFRGFIAECSRQAYPTFVVRSTEFHCSTPRNSTSPAHKWDVFAGSCYMGKIVKNGGFWRFIADRGMNAPGSGTSLAVANRNLEYENGYEAGYEDARNERLHTSVIRRKFEGMEGDYRRGYADALDAFDEVQKDI